MPRDGSGVYSLPTNSLATANTTIESAKYNAVLGDFVAQENELRPLTAGGTGVSSLIDLKALLGTTRIDGSVDDFTFTNASDATKKVTFDASGISSGQNRTVTFPDEDIDLVSFVGQICYFAMSTAPAGFLKCNGAAISRTTYAALFAKIGTTFGVGDGSTTFNLPDLRGEFIRSLDDGRGIDASRALGSFQDHAAKAYWSFFSYDYSWDGSGSRGTVGSDYADIAIGRASAGSQGIHRTQTTDSSGAVSSESRPRNIAMLACIKY